MGTYLGAVCKTLDRKLWSGQWKSYGQASACSKTQDDSESYTPFFFVPSVERRQQTSKEDAEDTARKPSENGAQIVKNSNKK